MTEHNTLRPGRALIAARWAAGGQPRLREAPLEVEGGRVAVPVPPVELARIAIEQDGSWSRLRRAAAGRRASGPAGRQRMTHETRKI
jgi:hypothetical protein